MGMPRKTVKPIIMTVVSQFEISPSSWCRHHPGKIAIALPVIIPAPAPHDSASFLLGTKGTDDVRLLEDAGSLGLVGTIEATLNAVSSQAGLERPS